MKDTPTRACFGKMAYANPKDADKHARHLMDAGKSKVARAYKCRFCEFYHVGNRKPYQLDWEPDRL
jgi:hypothetical protein